MRSIKILFLSIPKALLINTHSNEFWNLINPQTGSKMMKANFKIFHKINLQKLFI